ncbi:pesticin C-terminus-like muramidase [Desulfocurvus vexinensis]|uniref:pesticin C-terminus-like muramidase n=1 Tax=Desulfocurvus vexinensis TaxID=399548 RepID=UPI0009FE106C|nr:pesticin C-terminus-like muramidase [Desulfocurvus vexinensis]
MPGRDSRKQTEQFFASVFQTADAREVRNRRAAEGQAYGSREWFAALLDESPAPSAPASAPQGGALVASREGVAPVGPGAGTLPGAPDGIRGLEAGQEPGKASAPSRHIAEGPGRGQAAPNSNAPADASQAAGAGTDAATGGGAANPTPEGPAVARQDSPARGQAAQPKGSQGAPGNPEQAAAEAARQLADARRVWAKSLEGTSIDRAAIDLWEGKRKELYVPVENGEGGRKRPIANSGVTIGGGLDLGQHNEQDLRKYRLPEDLHQKLLPALGVKGEAAIEFVQKNKIVLTEAEEAILAEAMHARITQDTREIFDSHSSNKAGVKFNELPSAAQTVLYSMRLNMGKKGFSDSRITIEAISNGNYGAASKELNSKNWINGFDRRSKEGQCLLDNL